MPRHPPVKELVRRLRSIGEQDGGHWVGNHPEEIVRYLLRAGFVFFSSEEPRHEYLNLTELGEHLSEC
jgi:hypothetical protein